MKRTTLQIIEQFDPCDSGRTFAEDHPDPRDALMAALASQDGEHWHFVRMACLDLLGDDEYAAAARQSGVAKMSRGHTIACGQRLSRWLDEQDAKEGK